MNPFVSSPRSFPFRLVAIASLLLLLTVPAMAQDDARSEQPPETAALAQLEFRPIGPAVMGGRIADIAAVDADTFYVGAATGNLWKTTNRGTTWTALFTDEEVNSIGDVTLAPSNPQIVWVGTGEANNRQSSPWGAGVYRSTDGGETWRHMGLTNSRHVGRILVHPDDPRKVWVAAVGNLWAASEDRGVYRTEDGGESWEKVLYVDADTGAIDLAMHPTDPDTILAAMYQRRRTACCFIGGGPGSGLYRTTDGGDSWQEITDGLPEGDKGRIGLDFYRADGNVAYAVVQAHGDASGVYRSEDAGRSWEQLSDTNPRPMYFSQIRVDPHDDSRVYVLGVRLHRSDDGGRTFMTDAAQGVHLDHHAMWIDPERPRHIILAGDGGVSVSFDHSESWHFLDNLPLGQFYEIGVDRQDPYMVYGGLQDNGSWGGPSDSLDARGIRNADWFNINGGDGFYTRVDPDDPSIMYAESQNGGVVRVDLVAMERQSLRPMERPDRAWAGSGRVEETVEEPEVPTEEAGAEPESEEQMAEGEEAEEEDDEYRWNWNTPIVISEHDPATLYVGANVLLRSPDRGLTWEQISPDLTRQIDRGEETIMGVQPGPRTLSRHDGISSYGNITTLSESPVDPDVLYVGTDDGNVHRTRDGGATWTDLSETFPGLPERTYVSRLVASGVDGRVYATFDNHYHGDFAPYVYVSDDFGDSWRPITEGLPDWSVNVIAEHPDDPELLLLGNEIGLYVSFDGGEGWQRLKNNLPTVPVDDLVIHPDANDLVVGTHGRSVWILDDMAPLQHVGDAIAEGATLLPVRDVVARNRNSPQGWVGNAEYAAPNPPSGAIVRYYLDEEAVAALTPEEEASDEEATADEDTEGAASGTRRPAGRSGSGSGGDGGEGAEEEPKVTLTVLDEAGTVVRELEGPLGVGVQQVVWDLRTDPPVEPDEEDQGGFFGSPPGIKVPPGTYTVRLEVGEEISESSFDLQLDPRIEIGPGDLRLRQEVMERAYEFAGPYSRANQAVGRLREVVQAAREEVEAAGDASEELQELVRTVGDEVRGVSEKLREDRRVLFAAFGVERVTARPTEDQIWAIDQARERLPDLIEEINTLITERVPALHDRMNEEGIRPKVGEPLEVPEW